MISNIAYAEVNYIINKMSKELRNKIPNDFIEFIEKNGNTENQIDVTDIDELDLNDDTKKILSLIYTDYIAPEEERRIIKNKEKIIEQKREEEKKKEYGVDVFQNKENSIADIQSKETAMITQYKEKWYIKLFNRIKKIFGK